MPSRFATTCSHAPTRATATDVCVGGVRPVEPASTRPIGMPTTSTTDSSR